VLATYDIVVIGGGLVGAAIAYGVAAGQRRVAMVDEGDVAYRAARGNFGLIWVQGKGMGLPAYAAWTRLSARRWQSMLGWSRLAACGCCYPSTNSSSDAGVRRAARAVLHDGRVLRLSGVDRWAAESTGLPTASCSSHVR